MAGISRPRAVLLLGPTGAGKTPLGELLEERGLGTARCVHFDFGQHLREAAGGRDYGLLPGQVELIRTLLRTNALLSDQQFPIAAAILSRVLAHRPVGPSDWLVLNGLPRHEQQALALERHVEVRAVAVLACTAQVVRRRIAGNAGGDRAARTDDTGREVTRKLEIFRACTQPLIEHYRKRGAVIIEIPVTARSTAADARDVLQRGLGL